MRIRKVSGVFGTIFWGGLAILFFFANNLIDSILVGNPEIQNISTNITMSIAGNPTPFLSVFFYLGIFAVFKAVNTWFSGIIVVVLDLIITLGVAFIVLVPILGISISVNFSGFTIKLDVFFTFLFWLILVYELIVLGIEIARAIIDARLEKEFAGPKAREYLEEVYEGEPSELRNFIEDAHVESEFEQEETWLEQAVPWLDPDFQTARVEEGSDDDMLLPEWTQEKVHYSTALGERFKLGLTVYAYMSVYVVFALVFRDHLQPPYDYSVEGLFLPFFFYFLVSFRSFTKFLFSLLLMAVLINVVIFPLMDAHLITYNAIPFVKYFYVFTYYFSIVYLLFVNPLAFFSGLFGGFIPPINLSEVLIAKEVATLLMNYLFIAEGILFASYVGLNWVFVTRKKKAAIALSQQHLFLRDKTGRSRFYDALLAISIVLNPLYTDTYRQILQRGRYNRKTDKEGLKHDFARIPFNALHNITKKRGVSNFIWILGLIMIVSGTTSTITNMLNLPNAVTSVVNSIAQTGQSFPVEIVRQTVMLSLLISLSTPFIGTSLVIFAIKKRKVYQIRLIFDRSKVDGSWKLANSYTTVTLRDVPSSIANLFYEKVPISLFPLEMGEIEKTSEERFLETM